MISISFKVKDAMKVKGWPVYRIQLGVERMAFRRRKPPAAAEEEEKAKNTTSNACLEVCLVFEDTLLI